MAWQLDLLNDTQSNLLRRSLQQANCKDETGHRLTDTAMRLRFGDAPEPDGIGIASGAIGVLGSHSNHPFPRTALRIDPHRQPTKGFPQL